MTQAHTPAFELLCINCQGPVTLDDEDRCLFVLEDDEEPFALDNLVAVCADCAARHGWPTWLLNWEASGQHLDWA
jgi:hypothetical protein